MADAKLPGDEGIECQSKGDPNDAPDDRLTAFRRMRFSVDPALIGGLGAMQLSQAMGNELMALPFTVVVSKDGDIVHRQLGPLKQPQLDQIIGRLL